MPFNPSVGEKSSFVDPSVGLGNLEPSVVQILINTNGPSVVQTIQSSYDPSVGREIFLTSQ